MSVGVVNKQTGERIPTAGMPAIDDALDLTSVNPVQNAVITAALANKQDKTDNALQTTDKTVVGAINEHEGDIGSLKNGLTNVNSKLSLSGNASSVVADNFANDSGFAITINGVCGVAWKIYFSTVNNRIAVEEWSNGSQIMYKSVTLT